MRNDDYLELSPFTVARLRNEPEMRIYKQCTEMCRPYVYVENTVVCPYADIEYIAEAAEIYADAVERRFRRHGRRSR